MASITKQVSLAVSPERAWAALRDVAHPHLLFAGVLTAARMEDGDRLVTFAHGMEVRERIVDLDEQSRRLAYTVVDGPFTHHHASFAVEPSDGGCTVRWVSDLLPDDAAPMVEGLMTEGLAAMASTLER